MKRVHVFPHSVIVLFALLLGACHAATPASTPALVPALVPGFVNAHAIIIVRHGDIDPAQKASLGGRAPLIPAGEARARELAAMLRDAGINRVVTSSALRTQQTAAPILQFLQAEKINITPEVASGHGFEKSAAPSASGSAGGSPPQPRTANALSSPAAEAAEVVDYLARTAKPTDTILVVHHHSVLPSLIEAFSHSPEPAIDDATEFDRCYVILPDAATHTYHILRLRYGGRPSPPPR